MKSITKRQLVRNPAQASALRPGESLAIADRQGGLVLKREKRVTLSPQQIESEVQRICKGAPKLDSMTLQLDEA